MSGSARTNPLLTLELPMQKPSRAMSTTSARSSRRGVPLRLHVDLLPLGLVFPLTHPDAYRTQDEVEVIAALHDEKEDSLTERVLALLARGRADRGRFLNDADNAAALNHVVVSSEVVQALSPEEDPIGRSVKVGTDYFTVVGVAKQANDLNDNAYMPLLTCRLRFGERIINHRLGTREAVETQLSRLILEVRDGADVDATAALVKSTLKPDHPKGDVEVVILKPDRKTK